MNNQDTIEINGKSFSVIAVSKGGTDNKDEVLSYSIDANHVLFCGSTRTSFTGGVVVALGEAEIADDEAEALARTEAENPFSDNLKKLEDLFSTKVDDKFPSLATFLNREKDSPMFCFEYKEVLELVFEAGRMTALIDHSRDMYRIRKNIEYGLRDLHNIHDVKSIRHFIKSIMACDYNEKWVTRR